MKSALVLQHVPFEGPGRLDPVLTARGYDVQVVPVHEGIEDLDPRAADLLVVMGGPMSVNDEASLPWLAPEKRAVREAIESGVPTLGVCLGSQIIASCLGAAVRSRDELEVGWYPVHAVRDEPLAKALAEPPRVMHWHGEQWDLPTGARLLVSSEGCDHQAFAIDDHVLGVQYHLEMEPEGVKELIHHCPEDLAPGPWVDTIDQLLQTRACFEASHAALETVVDEWIAR